MAHHKSTPQSVLDAPGRTLTWISRQHGTNRRDRRHVRFTAAGPLVTIPRAFREMATNHPYEPTRGTR